MSSKRKPAPRVPEESRKRGESLEDALAGARRASAGTGVAPCVVGLHYVGTELLDDDGRCEDHR